MKERVTVDREIQERIVDFPKTFWPALKLNYILLNKIANIIGLFESSEATFGDVVYHLNCLQDFVKTYLASLDLCATSKELFFKHFEKRFQTMVNNHTCLANLLHPNYCNESKGNLTSTQTMVTTDFFEIYA